jgi:hypothetical protein
MTQTLQLRKVRDFGERIGDTMTFIKLNWARMLGLYAVFVIPFLLAGIVLGANSIVDFITKFSGSLNAFTSLMGIKLTLAMIMFFFASSSYTAVVFLYMDHVEKNNGTQPDIADIGRRLLKPLLYNMGYSILVVAIIIILAVFFTLGVVSVTSKPILFLIAVPLCLFGGLFAMVYVLMMFPVNVIEDGKFGSAIPGTFQLLRGRWWFTIAFVIILFIIYYFFSLAISTMVNLLFGLTSINMMDPEKISGMGKTYAYVFGLNTIIQQVFYLVIFVGCGIHFYSTQEEKLGAGLEQQIDKIGVKGHREEGKEETW